MYQASGSFVSESVGSICPHAAHVIRILPANRHSFRLKYSILVLNFCFSVVCAVTL